MCYDPNGWRTDFTLTVSIMKTEEAGTKRHTYAKWNQSGNLVSSSVVPDITVFVDIYKDFSGKEIDCHYFNTLYMVGFLKYPR